MLARNIRIKEAPVGSYVANHDLCFWKGPVSNCRGLSACQSPKTFTLPLSCPQGAHPQTNLPEDIRRLTRAIPRDHILFGGIGARQLDIAEGGSNRSQSTQAAWEAAAPYVTYERQLYKQQLNLAQCLPSSAPCLRQPSSDLSATQRFVVSNSNAQFSHGGTHCLHLLRRW